MEKEEYIEIAKERIKDHKYTLLASGDGCEIWKCRNPKSIAYCFNISIMPYSIAVVGDIGDYTFNYHPDGMGFLAGDDVNYYIHKKLTQNCKEIEFDKEKADEYIFEEIKSKFDNDESLWDIFSEDTHSEIQNYLTNTADRSLKNLEAYFRELRLKINNSKTDNDKNYLDDFILFLMEADYSSSHEETCQFLDDDELVGFDILDCDFTKPHESLVQTLYTINEAAKQIMEIKSKNTEILGTSNE